MIALKVNFHLKKKVVKNEYFVVDALSPVLLILKEKLLYFDLLDEFNY